MLTVKEQQGLTLILQKLSMGDLSSIAYTTTKGMIDLSIKVDDRLRPNSNNGYTEIILKYTEKSSHLLRRRKVKKEYIFQYLHEEGVHVSISAEKSECIKTCLKHWESPEHGQDLTESLDDDDVIMEEVEEQSTSVISSAEIDSAKLKSMGETFTSWFYRLLKEGSAGPEHFWRDASLQTSIEDTQQKKLGLFSNADNVSHFLRMLCSHHQILLDPNVLGVKSKFDTFGMVKVGVHGVVHRSGTCVGLFQQEFGLVRDPTQDSWKIKFTNLRMKINCDLVRHILLLHQLKNA